MNQTTAPGQPESFPASNPPEQSLPHSSTQLSSESSSQLPPPSSTRTEAPPSLDFQTWFELTRLYADYAAVLDAGDWYRWPDFFTEECSYKLQPRENFERGFPLCTLSFESRGMLKDRAYGISETIFHDPYYQRHVTGLPRILKVGDGVIESEAGYAVFRTKPGELSTVFNVGRYIDRIVRTAEGLKFQSRRCVFDSEMIPNSIIYPI